ncbi:hypothetical protein ANCCAN_26161 [Ancylostoma caninum]|uniref:Uncharacterized protein n=1 Tax=Ancylostoma caninum TaxID=29170 RepID=A0A368F7H2_ANCCA|nr:hypothetical protein ANCCAN_26161 [Ancylostoma caninum]
MVTLRPHVVQKRKNQKPLTSSNPKRCGSIQRLADNLMGCSSFAAPGTMAVENVSALCVRYVSYDEDSKYYIKRPPVDRLNPELVQKVERIVSGDLTKQRESELYAEKTRKVLCLLPVYCMLWKLARNCLLKYCSF